MANYITTEDVRAYILDRSPEDNELLLDLEYSPDEISTAMRNTARKFNSMNPFSMFVEPDHLDGTSELFLHGIVYQLFLMTNHKLKRNDIDYTSGGVGTSLEQKKISHLDGLIAFHKEEFEREARAIKLLKNINDGFGAVG